jgi:hypothetical protein
MAQRRLRDERRLTTPDEQWFVRQDYKYSPPVADYIKDKPMLKA